MVVVTTIIVVVAMVVMVAKVVAVDDNGGDDSGGGCNDGHGGDNDIHGGDDQWMAMLMVGSAAGVVVGEVAAAAEKEKSESREKRSQKLGARRKGAAIRRVHWNVEKDHGPQTPPPFGLKAALANKFIDKPLTFRPKLLILTVPPETERLDEKRSPYDLVWDDKSFLLGKSFYLLGSVDANDRQIEQWNVKPPPLYLWSRPDWTDKHKVIAQEHGHFISQRELSRIKSFDKEKSPASHTMDDSYGFDIMPGHNILNSTDAPKDEGQTGCSPHGNVDRESQERLEYRVRKADKTSWKRKRTEENDGRLDYDLGDKSYRHMEPTSSSRMGEIRAAYSRTQNWPSFANPLYDSGITDVGEHRSSLPRDTAHSFKYRPYAKEDENYLKELDTRQQTRHYGIQNPNSVTSNYLSGSHHHMGPSYPACGLASESPYVMNTPAMQRYAPRPDELNHARMDPLGS
ncbi:Protein ENHANCED DOWNY MILDEW 2 isoform B [Glycine soja]|uniref:Protein ENHANCED DOWNY MILDEW 2 isoform B n=1 Tax=Glycine soja TaxID=3848 RepID=A0A445JNC0_GLYSO|nr:Protein ENHANCED DOWNY MILDEW 2 isoform B [Glycine soja]